MAFTWVVSRIIRLFGQKTNALFYQLVYRELQREIVELSKVTGVAPDQIAKQIGKRAARESAERHANVLGLVPINPNSPEKIVKYIEVLWFVLFGQNMKDYEIRIDDDTVGHQKITFLLKHCPVCMGHEDDVAKYQLIYKTFSGKDVEGYACLMAGMLEELATIILSNKGLDIRIEVRETSCYARGDKIMAVQAQVMSVQEYDARPTVDIGVGTEVPAAQSEGAQGVVRDIVDQSTRLFEQISEKIQLDKIDGFFDDPTSETKLKIAEMIENQLHFTPKDILAYFENYETDIFRVIGYLAVHALNELGKIVENIASNFLLSKIVDILLSAFEYGLETYIPEKILLDNKTITIELMNGWAMDKSVDAIKDMDSKEMLKLVLEGVKLALADYGAEFVGAKDATWILLKRLSVLTEEQPSDVFSLTYDIFQEAAMVAGYMLSIPVKVLASTEYETVRTPVTMASDVYKASREHVEKLFDLIERFQELDLASGSKDLDNQMAKAFPKMI